MKCERCNKICRKGKLIRTMEVCKKCFDELKRDNYKIHRSENFEIIKNDKEVTFNDETN